MQATTKKSNKRFASRNPTEAVINCRPFTSKGTFGVSDGVMHNYSSHGAYVETAHNYGPGTILILRTVRYPAVPSSEAVQSLPRSICLAEVKWRQDLADENDNRYGLGLKYLG
jgi:hypothetical protein